MRVSEMIRDKSSKVITVLPTESVERASRDAGVTRASGPFPSSARTAGWRASSRNGDIVHGVASRGAGVLADPVSVLMTHEVRTCTPESSIDQLMEQMLAGRIRHLPVVDRGALVGIVSVGDVVKQGHAEVLAVRDTLQRYIREASARAMDYD